LEYLIIKKELHAKDLGVMRKVIVNGFPGDPKIEDKDDRV